MAKARRTTSSRTRKAAGPVSAAEPRPQTTETAGGVLDLLARTAVTALSGVRDVGTEVGTVAVTAVRGSVRAAGEVGADVGRLAAGAAEGAIDAADRIAVAAGRAVGNLVSGAVEGVREIMQGATPRPPAPLGSREPARRAAPRAAEPEGPARRKPLARRPSRAVERARPARRRSSRAS